MKFDFENSYEDQNYNENELMYINDNNLDIPIGWSSICFNETINFYTDCNIKTNDIEQ